MTDQKVFETLHRLGISYELYEHEAVFTVDEAKNVRTHHDGAETKNLFLRNQKKSKYYLVVMVAEKRADLKRLAEQLQESKLSFASPEDLQKFLGLTPGSVSPFGLLNDNEVTVIAVIDQAIFDFEKVGFHPNRNTATLVLTTADFRKFLSTLENPLLSRPI